MERVKRGFVKLALTDTEHLGAANGADTFGSRLAILHLDGFGALHLSLGATLHTICLHRKALLLSHVPRAL